MLSKIKKYFRVKTAKNKLYGVTDHSKVQPFIDHHLALYPEDRVEMDVLFKQVTTRIALNMMRDSMVPGNLQPRNIQADITRAALKTKWEGS